MPQVGSPQKATMPVTLLPRLIPYPVAPPSVYPLRQHAVGGGFLLLATVAFFAAFNLELLADVKVVALAALCGGGLICSVALIAACSGKLHLAEQDFTREEMS